MCPSHEKPLPQFDVLEVLTCAGEARDALGVVLGSEPDDLALIGAVLRSAGRALGERAPVDALTRLAAVVRA
ncbi:MAG: hypothetical protein H7123_08785, partial [Thermoleophilia bacterium]|nr:hypothetical protein [Thermoleophilia bacterium]